MNITRQTTATRIGGLPHVVDRQLDALQRSLYRLGLLQLHGFLADFGEEREDVVALVQEACQTVVPDRVLRFLLRTQYFEEDLLHLLGDQTVIGGRSHVEDEAALRLLEQLVSWASYQ